MPESVKVIHLADFSVYPAGRDEGDGPDHGQRFRTELLYPALRIAILQGTTLTVSLDGVRSFGSSFLEEAFGGLVRAGLKSKDIHDHLKVVASSPGAKRYVSAIMRYIEEARPSKE